MAALVVTPLAAPDITDTLTTANAGGDTFGSAAVPMVAGRSWIECNNASGGSITVTIDSQAIEGPGEAESNRAVAVGAGVRKKLLIEDNAWIADGVVTVTYSGVTTFTVGAFKV